MISANRAVMYPVQHQLLSPCSRRPEQETRFLIPSSCCQREITSLQLESLPQFSFIVAMYTSCSWWEAPKGCTGWLCSSTSCPGERWSSCMSTGCSCLREVQVSSGEGKLDFSGLPGFGSPSLPPSTGDNSPGSVLQGGVWRCWNLPQLHS